MNWLEEVMRILGKFLSEIGKMGKEDEIIEVKVVNIGKGMGEEKRNLIIMGKMGKKRKEGKGKKKKVEGIEGKVNMGVNERNLIGMMRIEWENRNEGFGMKGIKRKIVGEKESRIVREEFNKKLNGGEKLLKRNDKEIRDMLMRKEENICEEIIVKKKVKEVR